VVTLRIGLDFGTANTVVAGWDDAQDQAAPLPLDGIDTTRTTDGRVQRVVPSLIAYHPERRWLGAQVTAELLDARDVAVFQATKSAITGKAIDVPVRVGERSIGAREAATQFLADVTALATLSAGTEDLEVVATAPVESFDSYRDWLAGEVATGLPGARLRVVDEATAAAVGHAVRMAAGQTACVIDFGAGTLDIAVVEVLAPDAAGSGAGVRTIAKTGLELGGRHVDALIAEHAATQVRLPPADQVLRNRVYRRLLSSAESAKIALAGAERAVVEATDPVTDRHYSCELTREDLDRLLREADIPGRLSRALRRTLDLAAERGHSAAGLTAVLLVGGSCLLPQVHDLVSLQFDPGIIHRDRPLEAVAAGAARIAGGHEIHDHIQHDYAIRHFDSSQRRYDFRTIVPAGTAFPSDAPVAALTIKAVRAEQCDFGLAIYELAHATYRDSGADLEIVFDSEGGARAVELTPQRRQERSIRWLNEHNPTFLHADPPADVGTPRFRVEFAVDAHKRLTVSAYDLTSHVWILDRHPVVRLS
jgi:molecular chaperone DnaK